MKALSVSIKNAGKKYGREWIFRDLNFEISAGDKVVIQGGNGSGKSTLLQIISGFTSLNEGEIVFKKEEAINIQEVYKQVTFASPYLQLIEDFTLRELLEHAGQHKPFIDAISIEEVLKISGLVSSEHKLVRQFSSGMKQRLKLTLALLTKSGMILLDEPVSNLDASAITWYKKLIADHASHRTVIVCSNNITDEYQFCTKQLNIEEFKPLVK